MIAQNAEINASRAVLERIIHLYTDKAEQSVETRYAAIVLERYPIEKLSGFLPTVLMKEAAILKQYNERVDGLQAQLFADKAINHERIAKNHEQLIALLETLALVLPVKRPIFAKLAILLLRWPNNESKRSNSTNHK